MRQRKLISRDAFWKLIGFTPHSGQLAAAKSNAKVRVFCAGRQTGKTLLWSLDDARILLSGPYRVWIVGPSHELTERCWRVIGNTLWRSPIKEIRDYCKPVKVSDAAGMRHVILRNGAECVGLSAQLPDKSLLGEEVDRLHITEAARITRRVYEEYLLPVTMTRDAVVTMDSTPRGQNWFFRLWERGQRKENGIESWKAPSWTNTNSFPLGERDPKILQLKETMSDSAFQQEICASFVAFQGRIVPEFDETLHVTDKAPRIGTVFGGLDWGWNHPAALVVGHYDYRTRSGSIIAEYVASDKRVEQILAVAVMLTQKHHVDTWFCGPERPENIAALNDQGVEAVKAENDHYIGVEALRSLCKRSVTEFGEEKTHLQIEKQCTETIKAFNTAHYKEKNGEWSEAFHDENLDPLDAARYLFASAKKYYDE